MSDDAKASVFYKPVANFPKGVPEAERARLATAYEMLIRDILNPAYRELGEFLTKEYLPQARATVGIGDLPGGQKWYAYLARMHTTTDLSPQEIHRIGNEQALKIQAEMETIRKQVGFDGDLQAFFKYLRSDPKFFQPTPDALLNSYRDLKADVDARVPRLFDLKPKADFIVEPIETSRPIWEREALFIHEAVPGHHFQLSIAQEQQRLPAFRRFQGPTAFVEGWGLYDRLVVDTGMHALGWTREQPIDFMMSNMPKTETDIIAEVERYMAIPGQALAYKIGQTHLAELRAKAEKALGGKFSIREFHHQVLADGAMPLALLEQKIDCWIQSVL